ncbi:MAG: hypothetical protein ACRD3E_15035 [Terriglobales bacterium]
MADLDTAREVCLRDGDIQGILAPRIERLGSSYQVSSAVVSCGTGETLGVAEAEAQGASAVLRAANDVSVQIRRVLGEAPGETNTRLAAVTTNSLDALKLFTESQKRLATAKPEDIDSAIRLLKQAVAIDPEFAMAWSALAGAITWRSEFTVPPTTLRYDDAGPYYERSAKLADHATTREKYVILGRYHQNWTMDLNKEVAAFETLHALYPDDLSASGSLALSYAREGYSAEAEQLYMEIADRQKNNFEVNWNSWRAIFAMGRWADAERLRKRAIGLLTADVRRVHPEEAAQLEVFPMLELLDEGNVDSALEQVHGLERQFLKAGSEEERYALLWFIVKFYLDSGQLRLAQQWAAKSSLMTVGVARNVAYDKRDRTAFRKLMLQELSTSPYLPPSLMFALLDFGMRHEVESKLPELRHDRRTPSVALVSAELDRQAGHLQKAIAEYQALKDTVHCSAAWFEPLMLDRLARAQEDLGDMEGAVSSLEVNAREPVVPLKLEPPWRAEARLHLARLYRKTGRGAEAEKIENELRNLYRFADPDFVPAKRLREISGQFATTRKRPPQRAAGS